MTSRTSCNVVSLKKSSCSCACAQTGVSTLHAITRNKTRTIRMTGLHPELEAHDDAAEFAVAGGGGTALRVIDALVDDVAHDLQVMIEIPVHAKRRDVIGVGRQLAIRGESQVRAGIVDRIE